MAVRPATALWEPLTTDPGRVRPCSNDLVVHPSGTELLVAVSRDVYVFSASSRQLLHYANEHDLVHCVAYWPDDTRRFASAGASGTIHVWARPVVEPLSFRLSSPLKYRVGVPIHCLAFKPDPTPQHNNDGTQLLAFAAGNTVGIWSMGSQKCDSKTTKHKLTANAMCCGWSSNGTHLAVGQTDGTVVIFSQTGQLTSFIKRSAPIWTLCWANSQFPMNSDHNDLLAVGCWDQTLSVYLPIRPTDLANPVSTPPNPCAQVELACYPYSLTPFSVANANQPKDDGPYVLMGGSDGQVSVWNLGGHLQARPIMLMREFDTGSICVWNAQQVPNRPDCIIVATADNFAKMLQIQLSSCFDEKTTNVNYDRDGDDDDLALDSLVSERNAPHPSVGTIPSPNQAALAIPLLATCWSGSLLRMEVLLGMGADFTARMSDTDEDTGSHGPQRSAMHFCCTWSFNCPRKSVSEIFQRRRLLSTHVGKAFRMYQNRLSCFALMHVYPQLRKKLRLNDHDEFDVEEMPAFTLTADLLGEVAQYVAVYWRLTDPSHLSSPNGNTDNQKRKFSFPAPFLFCRTFLSYYAKCAGS